MKAFRVIKKKCNITISVLIPLYNGVEFLHECVRSIQHQTFQNWTCTVGVNGHGPDGGDVFVKASQIVRSLNDRRFSVVNIPGARGAAEAINWLVTHANTLWVAHVDADDYWHPEKLQMQTRAIMTHKTLDVVGTWVEYFGDLKKQPPLPRDFINPAEFKTDNPMIHSSILIKKPLAVYTNEFLTYDYDCWCRNLVAGAVFFNVPHCLTYHRIHNDSAFNASGRQRPELVRSKYFGPKQPFASGGRTHRDI